MFKVGDNVRVIRGCGKALPVGAILRVGYCGSRYVNLVGVGGGWYHDRFEIAAAAPTARANDPDDSDVNQVHEGNSEVPNEVIHYGARSNDPTTSKGKRKVNKYEQAVLKSLAYTKVGRTGKEIASDEEYPLNCITPRFAPLRRKGLIKDSGIKRDKQIVWVLA